MLEDVGAAGGSTSPVGGVLAADGEAPFSGTPSPPHAASAANSPSSTTSLRPWNRRTLHPRWKTTLHLPRARDSPGDMGYPPTLKRATSGPKCQAGFRSSVSSSTEGPARERRPWRGLFPVLYPERRKNGRRRTRFAGLRHRRFRRSARLRFGHGPPSGVLGGKDPARHPRAGLAGGKGTARRPRRGLATGKGRSRIPLVGLASGQRLSRHPREGLATGKRGSR